MTLQLSENRKKLKTCLIILAKNNVWAGGEVVFKMPRNNKLKSVNEKKKKKVAVWTNSGTHSNSSIFKKQR